MDQSREITPSHRTENIKYAVRDIVVLAKQAEKRGKKLLYLNIGDPNQFDFATPNHFVEAMCEALKINLNGYAPSSGIKTAVDAVEREAQSKSITNINDIFITNGASEAIELCLTSLVNSGENVLTPSPGYPLYTAIISRLEAEENPYYLDEANDWQPDIADIERKINDKTRAIILINPNNPTGSNCSRQTLIDLIAVAKRHDLIIFADEIYDKLLMDNCIHISIASLDNDIPMITFGGISKNYFGPGLRLGWGIVSGNSSRLKNYVEAVNKLLRARLCANHPLQHGIVHALEGPQDHIGAAIEKLTRRRDMTYEMLNAIDGISCVKPGGAFYAFPRLCDGWDDYKFVTGLIEETGVVTVPGSGFGQLPGTGHFRVVYLPQDDILEKAYNEINRYTKMFAEKNS
jgi:alanine-synthesizing transaminase